MVLPAASRHRGKPRFSGLPVLPVPAAAAPAAPPDTPAAAGPYPAGPWVGSGRSGGQGPGRWPAASGRVSAPASRPLRLERARARVPFVRTSFSPGPTAQALANTVSFPPNANTGSGCAPLGGAAAAAPAPPGSGPGTLWPSPPPPSPAAAGSPHPASRGRWPVSVTSLARLPGARGAVPAPGRSPQPRSGSRPPGSRLFLPPVLLLV